MKKIDESWYRKPEGVSTHYSAGGVVARRENGGLYIALIHEHGFKSYVLPKGHIEPGESPEQAAIREVEEEAGFTRLRLIAPLGDRERLDYKKRSWKVTHYFLFLTDEIQPTPKDARHEFPPAWFSIDALPQLYWPEQDQLLRENSAKIQALIR